MGRAGARVFIGDVDEKNVDAKLTGETAEKLQNQPIEWDTNLVLLPGK